MPEEQPCCGALPKCRRGHLRRFDLMPARQLVLLGTSKKLDWLVARGSISRSCGSPQPEKLGLPSEPCAPGSALFLSGHTQIRLRLD